MCGTLILASVGRDRKQLNPPQTKAASCYSQYEEVEGNPHYYSWFGPGSPRLSLDFSDVFFFVDWHDDLCKTKPAKIHQTSMRHLFSPLSLKTIMFPAIDAPKQSPPPQAVASAEFSPCPQQNHIRSPTGTNTAKEMFAG